MRQRLAALLLVAAGLVFGQAVKVEFQQPKEAELVDRSAGLEVKVRLSMAIKDVRVYWCNGDEDDLKWAQQNLPAKKPYIKPEDCHTMTGGPRDFTGGTDISAWDWRGTGPYPIFVYAVKDDNTLVAISELRNFKIKPKE